jgi:8-oxo-dGTP pyrophosphatase MutT (NUDIX family)
MKPVKVNTIHDGFLKVQQITLENPEGSQKVFDRVLHKPVVVGVCHDPITDKVLLVSQFRVGSMRTTVEFPAGIVDTGEQPHAAVVRELLEETGVVAKSATLLHEFMPMQGSVFAPVSMFYITYDSRTVEYGQVFKGNDFEETTAIIKSAKELIREVQDNQHQSAPIIIGAQYLKMLHKGLIK